MANRIRTGDPCGFNKGRSSKFCIGSQVQQTPEIGWRTYRSKLGNNSKNEDNSLKTLNDKNHQASFKKFRQLCLYIDFNDPHVLKAHLEINFEFRKLESYIVKSGIYRRYLPCTNLYFSNADHNVLRIITNLSRHHYL